MTVSHIYTNKKKTRQKGLHFHEKVRQNSIIVDWENICFYPPSISVPYA